MNEIKKIENRINKSKGDKPLRNSRAIPILSFLLLIVSLTLGFLIYAKKDGEANFINNVFKTNLNFTKFNETMNKFFDNFLKPKGTLVGGDDVTVRAEANYLPMKGNWFKSESNGIEALSRGKVLYVAEDTEGFVVVINYSNGLVATYSHLLNPQVKNLDFVSGKEILGSYEESFKMILLKDGVQVPYAEAFNSN